MSNLKKKHQDLSYKRDQDLHAILMVFGILVVVMLFYLAFEILTMKPNAPPVPEGTISKPAYLEEIDNRKELNLELQNDQNQ